VPTVQTVAMWFSAMLKVDGEVSSIWRTVVVFQAAEDWDAARLKAVELGRAKNETYANGDGRAVAHQCIGVETLDMLGE
jgi:hypothetical protein